ncbi:MAG: hybrid sensor histidine kinase/response regulator, partial [Desulfobulbaceae bacterium]|nr:hybrid sensor histidine kinase/response regulator [Desulfobulbaceae bacterium]
MILDTQVAMAKVGDLDSDEIAVVLPMYVLFASVIEPDLLGDLLGIDSSKVTLVPRGQESSEAKIKISDREGSTEAQDIAEPPEELIEQEPVAEKTAVKTMKEKKTAAKPAPAKKPAPSQKAKAAPPPKAPAKAENLRVPVAVLDQLMNRAGELVLARNALLQAIAGGEKKDMAAAGQRINMVTSELQEAIMLTRMQTVGNIFNKFTRVVRDMARNLGKQMTLEIEGSEVELDKSIIEGLGDPLTHLVRNSCDHGIELPEVRTGKGKPAEGSIFLRAFHESGQVIIEIEDDGKGLDPDKLAEKAISKGMISEDQAAAMSDKEKTGLIMLPSFSTAEQVTEVSGRGVGMDV